MKPEFQSRKFILALGGLALSTALLLFGKITSGDFVTITLGLSGAYIAANAWGKQR